MRIILCCAAAAAAYVAFMIYAGLPSSHSTRFNYAWLVGYTEAFQSGAMLPRFLPTLNGGIGGFDFFFQGPLPFWLTSAVAVPLCPDCLAETPFIATIAGLSILGSWGVYLLCRRFFGHAPSAAGAIFYALLPYHLWVDWIFRQAATEYAAYAFLPFIALGVDQLRQQQRRGGAIVFGVLGTVLCHLPTALLAAHVFGLLALANIFHVSTPPEARLRLFGNYVLWSALGVLLGSLDWLPALALLPHVSTELLYSPYFTATNWLFGPQTNWLFGGGPNPVDPETFLYKIIAFMFGAIISGIAAFRTRGVLRMIIVLPVLLTLFMNTTLSTFLWEHWIIQKVQFPWRFMVFTDLATALAAAAIVASVSKKALKAWAITPLVAGIAVTGSMIYHCFLAGALPGQTSAYD